jgi:adenylyltransferase/sulfurtransferase
MAHFDPDRYSRQTRFAPLGPDGQSKLATARVAVLGCGALGSASVMALARAGVGFLRLIDRDVPEPSNLPRQVLFDEADLAAGLPKAVAAARHLARINSAAALEPIFHGSARQPISAGDITTVATMAALVLSIIAIVGGAALTEELYFRGLLYGRLDARLGVASAVVGSAGAFALAHFDPNAFPVLLVLGLILGFVRLRTGSVWPGVGLHAANNVIAVIALLAAR